MKEFRYKVKSLYVILLLLIPLLFLAVNLETDFTKATTEFINASTQTSEIPRTK